MVLRQSMIKYCCEQAAEDLDILDYNRFHRGFINRQIILLLSTLGVPDAAFLRCQQAFVEQLQNATFKDCSIFRSCGVEIGDDVFKVEPVEDLVRAIVNLGLRLEEEPFVLGVLSAIKRKGMEVLIAKANFVPADSARLIGVLDEYGLLQENEIFVSYKPDQDSKDFLVLAQDKVVITRNPCLHPGDVRVVRAVGSEEIIARMKDRDSAKLALWRGRAGLSHVF